VGEERGFHKKVFSKSGSQGGKNAREKRDPHYRGKSVARERDFNIKKEKS